MLPAWWYILNDSAPCGAYMPVSGPELVVYATSSLKVKKFLWMRIFAAMYKVLRTILFFFPPEEVHHFSMRVLRWLCGWGLMRRLVTWSCRPEEDDAGASDGSALGQEPASKSGLERQLFGLRFSNPVGLGAGFDKNALYLRELDALGFGFVEIGTVTPLPQAGNEKPRLFRLPQDQALINRMGFNNDGVTAVAERVRAWRGAGATAGGGLRARATAGAGALG